MLAASLSMALMGCETASTVTEAAKVAAAIGHVRPSVADTCETQRQLAAQSSKIDTIMAGKEVVYAADKSCLEAKPSVMSRLAVAGGGKKSQ